MKNKSFGSLLIRNVKWFTRSVTALHGMSQLSNKSGKSLAAWTLVIFGNFILTGWFVAIAKDKYDNDAMVTQVDANCNVSQVPFPAISICNFNLVSMRESKAIEALLIEHDIPQPEIDSFFHALFYLHNFDTNSTNIGNHPHIMAILKYHYYFMDTLMAEVHQKCESLLLYCSFNGREKNCSKIFRMIKTLEGYCCTFNYGGDNEVDSNSFMEEDDDFEYFDDDENDDGGPITHKLIVTSEFGRFSGLFVVFDVEPSDYPRYSRVQSFGAKILVNDPYDFPETTTKYHLSTPGESVDLKVEPQYFQVQNELRKMQPSQRKCWFHNEVNLENTDRYSYETCNTECRMNTYLSHCGCVPYKYLKGKSERFCEFKDLKCLNNVTVHISKKEMECNPPCYIECSDKKYITTEDTNTIISENLPERITKDRVGMIHKLSAAHVYYRRLSCNCYKLTLLLDINYVIATYGGVFSLSFGASLITIVELVYLSFRFFIITLYYFIEKHTQRRVQCISNLN